MQDSALNLLKREFALWGVKVRHHDLNSGHIKLEWQASPDKPGRYYIIPKTAGDHRSWLNARSKIRQYFKADGLVLKEEIAKPKPALLKALSTPEPVEKDSDQLKLLRAEVGELTEMIFELATVVSELRKSAEDAKVAAAPPPPAPPEPILIAAASEPEKKLRGLDYLDYLSLNWNSTDVLARDMGLEPEIAYRRLYYLVQKGMAEHHQGLWRKKRADVIPAGIAAKKRNGKLNGTALNGHH